MSPPDQRMVIEQAKFAYSPLGKVFEKQTKTIEDQGKKQINAIEDHGKKLVECNEFIKKDRDRDSIPLDKRKKKYLMNLLKKDLLDLEI